MISWKWGVTLALSLAIPTVASGGVADVLDVEAERTGAERWRFTVTVRHADEGWDHYADAWQVVAPDGTVLGIRKLHHPHVDEQPFTRSLSGIEIPSHIDRVTVRARDKVHGFGGKTVRVPLRR